MFSTIYSQETPELEGSYSGECGNKWISAAVVYVKDRTFGICVPGTYFPKLCHAFRPTESLLIGFSVRGQVGVAWRILVGLCHRYVLQLPTAAIGLVESLWTTLCGDQLY